MKTVLIAASLALVSPAFASSPIATKLQNSGHTPVGHLQTFACGIYADRVEIMRTFGDTGLTVSESRAINVEGSALLEMIKKASSEEFIRKATLCDAPETDIAVFSAEAVDGIKLLARSSCNEDGERHGPYSTMLLNFINSLCGEM